MMEWMSIDPKTLHEIERKLIMALANGEASPDSLAQKTGLNMDQVRRGIEWLKYKNLIRVIEQMEKFVSIGSNGVKAAEQGLPERRLVNALRSGEFSIMDAKSKSGLSDQEFNVAISNARAKGWIKPGEQDRSAISVLENIPEAAEELLLRKLSGRDIAESSLSSDEASAYRSLKRRPNYVVEKIVRKTEVELGASGREIIKHVQTQGESRAIDVVAPAPIIHAGRKHPLQDIVDEVREIFIGLGFQEIDGPMVQNGFWNFDALFTPQDHPAREMQDTFYISGVNGGSVADKNTIARVSSIHKKGWNYRWKLEDAKRLLLRTHTTPVTIRYLADHKPEESRVFCVGRVFRNEKLTYKHLAEFYQVEGIVVGKDVTLRDLMGLQTEFYAKMGLKKVKFWPSFFPYTEPSLQSMVYHEKLGKWVELFGMGIFRPEVTNPVGMKNPVLAWGGGLERIAMLRYGLDDVRELYTNSLGWLRGVPKCRS
jgi:phenylalanyl-tRNA synthetase alpha chain